MTSRRSFSLWAVLALLASLSISMVGASSASEQLEPDALAGSGFTYQGQLGDAGGPVNATCDLQFTLWDAMENGSQVGSAVLHEGVLLEDGLFTVRLDFGAAAFQGDRRWLEVSVSCPAGSSYVTLTPRQELTASPYALSAPWSGLSGVPAGFADGVDNDTTYSAGAGLVLEGTEFRANRGEVQWRVSGTCAAGSSIREIDVDGSVICEADTDTTYGAGTGLTLSSGQFSVNFGGSGEAVTASRSDHNHDAAYVNEGQANSVSTGMVQNSTLLLEDLNQNGCGTDQVIKWTGSTWACAGDETGGSSFWSLNGNAGTTPGTNYLGTSDTAALEIKINGARALRLEPASSPNLLGGYSGNQLTSGVVGATISGGGSSGNANRVTDNWGTVGGGTKNRAGDSAGSVEDARFATVSGGYGNTAGKDSATVGGGYYNSVIGVYGTVGGGEQNHANGERSTVAGGSSNEAIGPYSAVGGGGHNTASGFGAVVAGGGGLYLSTVYTNTASGDYSTVSGGRDNTASSSEATVGGGSENTASGGFGVTVSGGSGNFAGSIYATIGGGAVNEITYGEANTIGGGIGNRIDGRYATIAGGSNNIASGMNATIGGGGAANTLFSNHATGDYATIGGGVSNFATAKRATIGGGGNTISSDPDSGNLVSDDFGTVGGGGNNQAGDDAGTTEDHPFATVGGGRDNTASGTSSVVAGGDTNTASGWRSTVPGGVGNVAAGEHSFAAGRRAKALHDGSFVWADATNVDFSSDAANEFLVRAYNGVKIVRGSSTFSPSQAALQVDQAAAAEAGWFYTAHAGNAFAVLKVAKLPAAPGNFIDGVERTAAGAETLRFSIDKNGAYHGPQDFAESLPVAGDPASYEPGDVLVISLDRPGGVEKCSRPYDGLVVGVYSTQPGFLGVNKEGATEVAADEVPVAVLGIVPVKVTDESGAIQPGDLLTTSSTPGHAMRCAGMELCFGRTLGKALEGLPAGQDSGVIRMLVSLQ